MQENVNYFGNIQRFIGEIMLLKHICLYVNTFKNILSRRFIMSNVVKIINMKQAHLYIKHHVKPIDVFDSEGKLVFVFDKEKTKDLFTKWCNYELK